MNKFLNGKNVVSIIAILILVLAIPEGFWPYGYYVFLRWVVTGVAIFLLWIASQLKKQGWFWLMVGVAILFNPIIPIHLDKGIWVIIDIITAVLFLMSIFKIKSQRE